jgi:VanZ family protein
MPTGCIARLLKVNVTARLLASILSRPLLLWLLFVGWLGLLFFASSSRPDSIPEMLFPHQDKAMHFVFFCGGGFVLSGALNKSLGLKKALLLAITLMILGIAGALDEYHQQFVPGRAGLDLLDWLADLCGATLGVFVFRKIASQIEASARHGI